MFGRRSNRFSTLIIIVAEICVLTFAIMATGQSDLKQQLNDQYKGKTFILRGFYSGHRLKYDSGGHVIDPPASGDWPVAGVVHVDDLRISGGHLKIEARRVHLGWIGGAFQELHDQIGKFDSDEKSNRSLRIEADLASSSADSVLSQIFLTSRDNFADLVPDYWKPCVRAALTGNGGKEYSACHFSKEFVAIPGVAYNSSASAEDESTSGETDGAVSRPGRDIHPPKPISHKEPEFSDEARRAKYQGVVVVSFVVDKTGQPRNIRIQKPMGMGLDRKAVETVSQWQFVPGTKDGEAIAVELAAETEFHLY